MCGRLTQFRSWEEMRAYYSLVGPPQNLAARYNVAPTDPAGTIRLTDQGLEHAAMRWWLVPFWWQKPLKSVPAAFNAKAEGIADRPLFREAFRRRRCIVWADGFYEWRRDGKARTPFYITRADGAPLSLAGLHERWQNPEDGETIRSCTIVTCPANAALSPLHDRMPAVLEPGAVDDWLSGRAGPELLVPAAEGILGVSEVSPYVNNVRNDGPQCIVPVASSP